MQILSDWMGDYYFYKNNDGGYVYSEYATDDGVVLDLDIKPSVKFSHYDNVNFNIPANNHYHRDFNRSVTPKMVFVGGVGYPFVELHDYKNNSDNEYLYAYNNSEFEEYMGKAFNCKKYKDIREFLDRGPVYDHEPLLVKHNIVIGLAEYYKREDSTSIHYTTLKEIDFHKVMTPGEVWQALSRYVGGVLVQPVVHEEIPNDVKIVKAGHDPKLSFRARSSGRKERRKEARMQAVSDKILT